MIRNSELKNLLRQLNKNPRTSLLKEDEKQRLLEVLSQVEKVEKELPVAKQDITKGKGRDKTKNK